MIHWRRLLILSALAGLWWLLSGGEPASWVAGAPVVLAVGWSAWRLGGDSGTVSVNGLLRFIPFLLRESLRGAIDVTLRALALKVRVQPGFTELRTGLRQGDARVFLVN